MNKFHKYLCYRSSVWLPLLIFIHEISYKKVQAAYIWQTFGISCKGIWTSSCLLEELVCKLNDMLLCSELWFRVCQCAKKRNIAKGKRGSLFSQIIVFITLAYRKTELLTIRHRRSFKKSLRQKLNSIFKALHNSSFHSLCFVFSSHPFCFQHRTAGCLAIQYLLIYIFTHQ